MNILLLSLRTTPSLRPILHQSFLYTSRAHPKPIPEFPISTAIEMVLDGAAIRRQKRAERWERNREKREKARATGSTSWGEKETPYRNQDETIEIAVNLNLDPKKPGQSLRGSFPLPHGTGRSIKLAAFVGTEDEAKKALEAGAHVAGGEELIKKIKNGEVGIDFDRAVATEDMMMLLSKEVARILGPRRLMPSPKLGTVITSGMNVEDGVKEQLAGLVSYKTDKEGIVHAPVGKESFGHEKITENVRAFMSGIFEVKPDIEKKKGKKKKGKGSGSKYLLKVHLSATQGDSVRVDLRTADPTGVFFMSKGSS